MSVYLLPFSHTSPVMKPRSRYRGAPNYIAIYEIFVPIVNALHVSFAWPVRNVAMTGSVWSIGPLGTRVRQKYENDAVRHAVASTCLSCDLNIGSGAASCEPDLWEEHGSPSADDARRIVAPILQTTLRVMSRVQERFAHHPNKLQWHLREEKTRAHRLILGPNGVQSQSWQWDFQPSLWRAPLHPSSSGNGSGWNPPFRVQGWDDSEWNRGQRTGWLDDALRALRPNNGHWAGSYDENYHTYTTGGQLTWRVSIEAVKRFLNLVVRSPRKMWASHLGAMHENALGAESLGVVQRIVGSWMGICGRAGHGHVGLWAWRPLLLGVDPDSIHGHGSDEDLSWAMFSEGVLRSRSNREFNVEFERLVLRLREVRCDLPPLVKAWLLRGQGPS